MKYVLPFALMLTILLASSQPMPENLPQFLAFHDKLKHFLISGLLATNFIRLTFFYQKNFIGALLSISIVALFSISNETLQFFIPSRHFELLDWAADTSGAITAILAYRLFPFYRSFLELNVAKLLPFRKKL